MRQTTQQATINAAQEARPGNANWMASAHGGRRLECPCHPRHWPRQHGCCDKHKCNDCKRPLSTCRPVSCTCGRMACNAIGPPPMSWHWISIVLPRHFKPRDQQCVTNFDTAAASMRHLLQEKRWLHVMFPHCHQ